MSASHSKQFEGNEEDFMNTFGYISMSKEAGNCECLTKTKKVFGSINQLFFSNYISYIT